MKRYRIAGLLVDMEASGRTAQQAAAYASSEEGAADITVVCDLPKCRELNPEIEDMDILEHLVTGSVFSQKLLQYDGLLLHSSAVILEGKAYLFSAPSGMGKSTHTEKWCRLFGASYLNDDKPVLRLVDGVWYAYGTPWSGKHDLSQNVGVPLGAIAVLRRAEENSIRRMSPAEALPYFMSQSHYRHSRENMELQLSLTDKLLRQIPVWSLNCRNEDAAAVLSRDAMTGLCGSAI